MRFAVLQEDFRELDFLELKEILTREGEMAPVDAARAAKLNRGILCEHLPAGAAGAV